MLADVGGVEVPEQGGVFAACSILANLISLQPVQPGCKDVHYDVENVEQQSPGCENMNGKGVS